MDIIKSSCRVEDLKSFLFVSDRAFPSKEEPSFLEMGNVISVVFDEFSLELIEKRDLDVIIVDFGEKETSGFEERFSMEIFAQNSVPVICMVEREDEVLLDRVKSLTDYGYIIRGTDPSVVRCLVDMACKLFLSRKNLKKRDLELKKIEDRQSTIMRLLRDKVVVTDNSGYLLEYHPSDGDETASSYMVGRHIGDFLDKDCLDRYRLACLKSLENEEAQDFLYHRFIDGVDRLFYAHVFPYDNDKFLSVISDVTENKKMESQLFLRTKELEKHRNAIIDGMAILAESRDGETGGHIRRTRKYVRLLLDRMESSHSYSPDEVDLICQCAVIHDIGKVSVPDGILLKPGKLTEREFDIVKKHPENGAKILNSVRGIIGDSPFFRYAMEIVRHHHERWDGRGYPDGLTGKAIPFTARLMAVADVYDALVSKRPYKRPFTHDEAVEIILDERGSHFDPYVVDVFLSCSGDFRDICLRFMNDNFD